MKLMARNNMHSILESANHVSQYWYIELIIVGT